MIKLTNSHAALQLNTWAQCDQKNLVGCFEKFNPDFHEDIDLGQFQRICGINFGKIPDDWVKYFSQKDISDVKIAMCLGVENEEFNIVFEVFVKGKSTYYGSDLQDGGRFYEPQPTEIPKSFSVKPNYGLLPVVKDHLCGNWYALPTELIPGLFIAQRFKVSNSPGMLRHHSSPKREVLDPSLPFNRMTVRGLKFPIVGYNKQVLQKMICEDPTDLEISIHFGANMADMYFNDDIFSPVIQVKKLLGSAAGDTYPLDDDTYLDFVHACPPTCPD